MVWLTWLMRLIMAIITITMVSVIYIWLISMVNTLYDAYINMEGFSKSWCYPFASSKSWMAMTKCCGSPILRNTHMWVVPCYVELLCFWTYSRNFEYIVYIYIHIYIHVFGMQILNNITFRFCRYMSYMSWMSHEWCNVIIIQYHTTSLEPW